MAVYRKSWKVNVSTQEMAPMLLHLVALVREGEEIYISSEGQLFARIVPISPDQSLSTSDDDEHDRPGRGVGLITDCPLFALKADIELMGLATSFGCQDDPLTRAAIEARERVRRRTK